MNDRITVFSIDITIKIPLRFLPFVFAVVAQLKAEVNGKNWTPLRFVAFAHCARLLPKTLIIPRVRLAIEFGSFFIYATILSFFIDFGDCDFNSHLRLLFLVLLRLCRKANKKRRYIPNEKSSLLNQKSQKFWRKVIRSRIHQRWRHVVL